MGVQLGGGGGWPAPAVCTDRYRGRQQLLTPIRDGERRAAALFRRLMDSSPIGMGLLDADGRFDVVNEALCVFFGYDADTLCTKSWQELTAPEFLDADAAKFADMLAGRMDSYRTHKQYVHAAGHPIWGDLSVSCLRTPGGELESFVVQIIDISAEVQSRRQRAEQVTAQLRSAAAYVAKILPGELDGPVRVSSRYLASNELAGDSFDYRWIDDDHLIVYLIDVSGHGIGPALLSVSVHNLLRSGSLPHATLLAPDKVLSELNQMFQMGQHDGNYFTMWFGVYESSSRTFRYASAGAPPAIAVAPEATTSAIESLATDGRPIAMFDDTAYTSRSYSVPHGCRILLYSDGAFEIDLGDGRQLSLTEFTEMFARLAAASDPSLDDVVQSLRSLAPSGTFEDDCSLVLLEFD